MDEQKTKKIAEAIMEWLKENTWELEFDDESCALEEIKQIIYSRIVSFGIGTNSTAMIIEMIRRGEQIDRILCADTGGERPETYAFLSLFSEWVKNRIGIAIEVVKDPNRTLEEDCLIRHALPSVVYGFKSCSLRYKVRPQVKAVKDMTGQITKLIGYDAGEPYRAKAIEGNRYPLIEWGITREMCVNIIKAEGLPLPGKSSCFFCPNSKRHEILALPLDLQDRAIEMERNAMNLTKMRGLGRTWKWEDLIMADRNQMTFDFNACDVQLPCECYDG